jgi:proteasome accessory factor C
MNYSRPNLMDNLYLLKKSLEIIPYIHSKGMKTSIKELQSKFNITRKALGEIMSMVFLTGFPPYTPETYFDMYIDEKNRDNINLWIQQKGLLDRPINLTVNEAYALLVLYRFIGRTVKLESLNTVIKKLEKSLLISPSDEHPIINELIDFSINRQSFIAIYDLVLDSIKNMFSLDIEYFSAGKNEMTIRRVDPYIIINNLSIWYFVGYCHTRNDFRMFRFERIKSIHQSDSTFKRNPQFQKSDYTSDDPFKITERASKEVIAQLRFNTDVSKIAKEEFYYADYEELPSGDLLVKVPIFSENWLLSKIRQFGSDVKILAPADLRNNLIRSYENLLNKYSN